MASLSLFLIERHSSFWLLRLPFHRSHQSKLPTLSGMEWGKRRWSQFKVPTARRLYGICKLSRDLIRQSNRTFFKRVSSLNFVEITSCVYILKQLFFSISVNSGFRNIYLPLSQLGK